VGIDTPFEARSWPAPVCRGSDEEAAAAVAQALRNARSTGEAALFLQALGLAPYRTVDGLVVDGLVVAS
jgi:hypothetical protein